MVIFKVLGKAIDHLDRINEAQYNITSRHFILAYHGFLKPRLLLQWDSGKGRCRFFRLSSMRCT